MDQEWKRYPHVATGGDPEEFTFPEVDGLRPALGMSTYYMDAFVNGASGRRYAFNFVFTSMRVLRRRVATNFLTFTLFDLDARTYGTHTEFDLPTPRRWWRGAKLTAATDHLDVRFAGADGTSRWRNRRDDAGALLPFASEIHVCGRDQRGQPMAIDLVADAERPPIPLGGELLGGRMMFLGARETYAYFQAGLRTAGRVRWGATDEAVTGRVGWIDRQWAPEPFNRHNDLRNSRYRNEWRALQLDNGWDLCVFSQYQRPALNRVVPWTGVTAIGPDGSVFADDAVEITVGRFIRDPGAVAPLLGLSRGPRYMPYGYRMRVPGLDLDVEASPFVDAPAQRMPIEYWTGPVALRGRMAGAAVEGLGFDERTRVWCRDFELAEVLRVTLEAAGVATLRARQLIHAVREVEAVLLRGGRREALAVLREIAPEVEGVPGEAGSAAAVVLRDLCYVIEHGVRAR